MDIDSKLMKEFQQGNKESFEKLIVRHRASALTFAKKIIKDPHLGEDMVQESFADLYVYRDRFNTNYSFKTYLFTIIRNKCIDYIRKNKALIFEEIHKAANYTVEKEILSKEQNSIIFKKINQMKEDYKIALYLVEYEELSYSEIANIMGKNLGQIKTLIYRARKKLQKLLKGEV